MLFRTIFCFHFLLSQNHFFISHSEYKFNCSLAVKNRKALHVHVSLQLHSSRSICNIYFGVSCEKSSVAFSSLNMLRLPSLSFQYLISLNIVDRCNMSLKLYLPNVCQSRFALTNMCVNTYVCTICV